MFSYFGFVDAKLLIVTKFLTEKVAFSLKDQFGLMDAHAFLANKFHEFMISFFNNVSFCRLLEHVLEIAGKFLWLACYIHREADMTKERIEKLLKAGANVVLTTKGIDDMALKASYDVN